MAGFDVQEAVRAATRERLRAAGPLSQSRLILGGHERMKRDRRRLFPGLSPEGEATALVFALGFLPGSAQTVVTAAHTTPAAWDAAARSLACGGVLSVPVYPGQSGMEEGRAVLAWSEAPLPKEWRVLSLSQPHKARNREWLIPAERLFPKGKGGAGRPRVRRGGCPRPAVPPPTGRPDRAGKRCGCPPE